MVNATNRQNILTQEEIGVAESKGGCGSVECRLVRGLN